MTDEMTAPAYEGWALVELMGHRQTAGRVAEVEMAGTKLLRVDTPGDGDECIATQFYGGPAIYCVTPCKEEVARSFLDSRPYNLPPAIELVMPKPERPALPVAVRASEEDEDEYPF